MNTISARGITIDVAVRSRRTRHITGELTLSAAGDLLRTIREQLGLSTVEVISGVPGLGVYVNPIENGKTTAKRLAEVVPGLLDFYNYPGEWSRPLYWDEWFRAIVGFMLRHQITVEEACEKSGLHRTTYLRARGEAKHKHFLAATVAKIYSGLGVSAHEFLEETFEVIEDRVRHKIADEKEKEKKERSQIASLFSVDPEKAGMIDGTLRGMADRLSEILSLLRGIDARIRETEE